MSKIIVYRSGNIMNSVMSYSLYIDGVQQANKISNGAINEFPLSAGNHTVSLKSIWFASRLNEFTIGENETKTFHVNIPPPMQVFTWILAILLALELYLEVHDLSPSLTGVLVVVTLLMFVFLIIKRNDILTLTEAPSPFNKSL